MAPKKASKSKNKKATKKHNSEPETANEYLAQGVDFEESAEKWTTRDSAKTARFHVRAIDAYDEGLKHFPQSFDLAYNKAHVQYSLVLQPHLLQHVSLQLANLTSDALASHRRALKLRPDDPDTLFNTAQVISVICESYDDERGNSPTSMSDPSDLLLLEGISLLQKCLACQESLFAQTDSSPMDLDVSFTGQQEDGQPGSDNDQSDHWASIEEPVTSTSLIETCTALLELYTTLFAINKEKAQHINPYIEELVDTKIPRLIDDIHVISVRNKCIVAKANLKAALAADKYFDNPDDFGYHYLLGEAFVDTQDKYPDLAKDEGFLSAWADALVESAQRLNQVFKWCPDPDLFNWIRLGRALEYLTTAREVAKKENISRIDVARGDIEMMRFTMSYLSGEPQSLDFFPESLEELQEMESVLRAEKTKSLENAEKHYREAAALARTQKVHNQSSEEMTARVKQAVSLCIDSNTVEPMQRVHKEYQVDHDDIAGILRSMVEDVLVSSEMLRECGLI